MTDQDPFEREAEKILRDVWYGHADVVLRGDAPERVRIIAQALRKAVLRQYEGEDSPVAKLEQAAYQKGVDYSKMLVDWDARVDQERMATFLATREMAASVVETIYLLKKVGEETVKVQDSEWQSMIAGEIRRLQPSEKTGG